MTEENGSVGTYDSAYTEGYQARLEGYAYHHCPYPDGSAERADWKQGWVDADDEAAEATESE